MLIIRYKGLLLGHPVSTVTPHACAYI